MRFDTFIKGKNVDLITLTPDLAENTNWYKWFNDEKRTQFMQKHYYPNTIEKQIFFAKSINTSKDDIVLGICQSEKLIGVCSLNSINYYNRNCDVSILIGEKSENDIISLEVFYLIINHAFYTLNLNKIKMGQHELLKMFMLRLYNEFGFIGEGVLKNEIYKNGKYYNVILSCLFKQEYEEKMRESKLSFVDSKFFKRLLNNPLH